MDIDERTRQGLYGRLDDVLGKPASDALMAHLPPVGWADVATKSDLASLEKRIDLRFEALEHRFGALDLRFESLESRLEAKFERTLRVTVTALVAAMVASVGAAVGITQAISG